MEPAVGPDLRPVAERERQAGGAVQRLHDVARGHDALGGAVQCAGLAEDVGDGGHGGQFAVGLALQGADHVTGAVAQDRHALPVGEVGGDRQFAEPTGGGGPAGLQVEDFGVAHVGVDVEVPLAAGAAADREQFGHAEGVAHGPGAEGLAQGVRQAPRQHLPAGVDRAQREVLSPVATLPGGGDHLPEVAGVTGEDGGPGAAARAEQVLDGLVRRDLPHDVAGGVGESAHLHVLLHGGRRPGAEVDLHPVAGPEVAAQHQGQGDQCGPQLHLVAGEPDLHGAAGGAGRLGRQVGGTAQEVGGACDEVGLAGHRDPGERLDGHAVEIDAGEPLPVERGALGEPAYGPPERTVLQVPALVGIGEGAVGQFVDVVAQRPELLQREEGVGDQSLDGPYVQPPAEHHRHGHPYLADPGLQHAYLLGRGEGVGATRRPHPSLLRQLAEQVEKKTAVMAPMTYLNCLALVLIALIGSSLFVPGGRSLGLL